MNEQPEKSTRSTLDEELRMMPEAVLLDNVHDEKERAVLESQLRALNKERKRKRLIDKPTIKLPMRDHFTVYDCTSEEAVHKPLSLLEPESCAEIELTHRDPVNVTVQVLQTGSRISVTAYRCSLTMTREVTRCGFDNLDYGTVITQLDAPLHLTPSQCRDAVTRGNFVYEKQLINITLNSPVVHSYYRYGRLSDDHECDHMSFSSNGRYFIKSYELSIIRVLVSTIRGRFNPATGRVTFSNGLIGNYQVSVPFFFIK